MEITHELFNEAFDLLDCLVNGQIADAAERAVLRKRYDMHPARPALEEVSHLFGVSMQANFAYMETVGEERAKWDKPRRGYSEHPCYVWHELALQRAAERRAQSFE